MNRAIVECHERGVLTSTSLMVTGAAWRDAVSLARSRPSLSVGLHLVLAAGRAVLPPAGIPHLVDGAGRFRRSPTAAGLVYQFLATARDELRREIRAQLERFRETGLALAHVDGHLHLHVHPVVIGVLADLAGEFGIRSVRLPSEELRLAWGLDRRRPVTKLGMQAVFGVLRRHAVKRLRAAGVSTADRVYGLHQTGRVTEAYLRELLPRIEAEWSEVYCHPAYRVEGEPANGPPGAGERELAALLSSQVRDVVAASGLALTASSHAAPSPRAARARVTAEPARSPARR